MVTSAETEVSRVPESFRYYLIFLTLLYLERGVELVVSRRNERRLRAENAITYGRGHFHVMAVFHAVFPAAAAAEVWLAGRVFPGLIGWAALAVALLAQGLRWWAVASLTGAWTVKILVSPRRVPVTRGPYRFVRHPNYAAVGLEVGAVPLIHGAWITALAGTTVNALLLRTRIRAEERALGADYAAIFAGRPRWLPGVKRDAS
jgi:methyltransferase